MGKKMPVKKNPGKKISRNESAIAVACVRMKTPMTIPILRIANKKSADSKKKSAKLPLKGISNHRIARIGITITLIKPTMMYGIILPTNNSPRPMGVARSCSSVPCSRSRANVNATERAGKPKTIEINPGMRSLRGFRLGLYQVRTRISMGLSASAENPMDWISLSSAWLMNSSARQAI